MARYALVIGISEYQSPRLGNLQKPVADAEAVAQILEQYGDFQSVKRFPVRWKDQNSAELATKKVTGVELGRELTTFLQEQAAHHEALIYFSGHGFIADDNLGQQKGYLAASDCQVEIGENHQVIEQRYGISLDSFNELIEKSQLSSLVVLLDCCHSGYFLERQLIKKTLTAFNSQKDYYLITACRSYEDALAIKTEEYSIFTNVVLKGLAPENASRNRRVSGDRLFDYVSSELKAVFQEPIRMGWGRSITLVTYPQLEATPNGEKEFNQENPYRGLYSFESEQAKYFFGRVQAIRALLDRINNNRFLAVIGASGCGKSSLVKAGLLPHLKDNQIPGSSQWEIEIFTPGKHPLTKLIEILDRQHKQNQPFIVFIDQLEEIFTLCEDDAERQSFIRLMAEEVTNCDQLTRVIVTIRTDFLDRCAAYSEAANLINRSQPTTYVVTPLTRPELEAAIKEPAALHGVKFQQGLITQIADDVDDQPGALPLLQYALKELWRVCIEKPEMPEEHLTWIGYEEIGGVKGALENRANLLYQSFSSTDQLFVRRMLMELVQLGDENQVTRRRAILERLEALADSIEQLRRVVQLLADQRLIVTNERTVEVAHEALLTEWTLLHGWIEENRENIRLSRLLETECREWGVRFKKSDEALLTGAKLATIAEWKEKTQPKLLVEEAEFLQKSLAKRDREIKEELEQERQLREAAEARAKAEAEKAEQERIAALAKIDTALEAEARAKAEASEQAARAKAAETKIKMQKQRTRFAIVGGILVTFTFGLGLLATVIEGKKRESEAIAVGALVGVAQERFKRGEQLEAMMASVEALSKLKEINNQDHTVLINLKSVINSVKEKNRLEGNTKSVINVTYSHNGELIASGSADGSVKIWSAKTGKILHNFSGSLGHKATVWSVKFAPQNDVIASGSADGTVKLWDLNKGKLLNTLSAPLNGKGYFYDVSFSPIGKNLITAGKNGITLWDIQNLKAVKKIETFLKNELIINANFNNDGNRIVALTSSPNMENKEIKILNLENRNLKKVNQLPGRNFSVFKLISNDEIVTSDVDRVEMIKIWNIKTLKFIKQINTKHTRLILDIAYNSQSKTIASSSLDETIKVSTIDGNYKDELKGHRGSASSLNFNPSDGRFMVSAGYDTTIRIWQVNSKVNLTNSIEDLLLYSCKYMKDYWGLEKADEHQEIQKICKPLKN